ncbi:hypothetical protein EB796_009620 [Bugula neritina]|nr:hypothetical protein EB796_016705 [Bugula neritina]KAF6032071.1 hypothetical protein EB796_009620 [Bugula neritina]
MPSDALNNTMSCDKVEMRRSLDPDWVLCIDPLLSLVLVAIILCTALPLLKHAAFVLMQSVPAHLDSNQLLREITQIKGVTEVHEFHIWSLSGNTVIASLHVGTQNLEDYVYIAGKVKKHLHNVGIHSVTIQPEFNELQMKPENRLCALECGPDMKCHSDTCCAKQDGHPKSVQRITSLDV